MIILAIALLIGAIVAGISYLIVTDEERIELLVQEVSQAIEDENMSRCMRDVSDDFIFRPKQVNKARLMSLVQRIFENADKLMVNISLLEIEVDGDDATVVLNFRLLGEYVGRVEQFVGSRGFILGQPLQAAKATLKLHKTQPDSQGARRWILYEVTHFDPGV
ncbi:MAG: hypothetical protein JW941_12930 [Candidatus Coatesbacteria bacterium]|nr:hypothetical protein [Candidatus Coatesbacteria bacterium]